MFMKADHLATLGRRALNAIAQSTRGRIFMGYQDIGSAISVTLNVNDTQSATLDVAATSLELTVRAYAETLTVGSQSLTVDSQSQSLTLEIE